MLQSPANKSAKAKGEVDEDSDNEEAIERDVKDADSFSMNDLISLAKSQHAGGSRSKVWCMKGSTKSPQYWWGSARRWWWPRFRAWQHLTCWDGFLTSFNHCVKILRRRSWILTCLEAYKVGGLTAHSPLMRHLLLSLCIEQDEVFCAPTVWLSMCCSKNAKNALRTL